MPRTVKITLSAVIIMAKQTIKTKYTKKRVKKKKTPTRCKSCGKFK